MHLAAAASRVRRQLARHRRWGAVVVLVGVLLSAPALVGAIPASSSSVSAATLLTRIEASGHVAYSGYAESVGGLDLPVTGEFGPIVDLFSGVTQLRAWYRDPSDWRVDTVAAFGESDEHQTSDGLWSWSYESNTAILDTGPQDPRARLPRDDDLIPPALARRVLSGIDPRAVTRLGVERIAGQDVAGIRMRPIESQSTIDHVDVWAIPTSGLPLRVTIYAKGSNLSVLSSSMLDVSTAVPSPQTIAFTPPAGAHVRTQQQPDVVSFVDQLGHSHPPAELAGLPRVASTSLGAVGAYGSGITTLIAIPLPPRTSGTLRAQLEKAGGKPVDGQGVAIGTGPLNLLLSPPTGNLWSWLLVGTVTADTLTTASAALPSPGGFR